MRCPAAVAPAACLAGGSNQHHHYYYHRRGVHFQYYCRIYFYNFQWRGGLWLDSIRLLQLGTAVGRDSMAVDMAYHGGFGGMGIKNVMMNVVGYFDKARGHVGLVLEFT